MRRPDDVSLKDRKDNFSKLLAYVQDDLCKEAFENINDTKHKHNNIYNWVLVMPPSPMLAGERLKLRTLRHACMKVLAAALTFCSLLNRGVGFSG